MRLEQYILQDSDEVTVSTSGILCTYLVYSTLYRNVSSESTTYSISMNSDPFDVKIDLFDVIPAVRVDHRVLYCQLSSPEYYASC